MKTMAPVGGWSAGADGRQGEAEYWLARLDSPECDTRDRRAFEDWLVRSPSNVGDYLDAERIHLLAASLGSDDLLRAASRSALRDTRGSSPSHRAGGGLALAASLLLVCGTAFWFLRAPVSTPVLAQHATAVGEQRAVTLADGTRLLLDTDTSVTTRFDADTRVLGVQRGRVQLVVAADRQRPFVVEAGASTIRDIGTTFQVSRWGDAVNVGLIDGAVAVTVAAPRGSARTATSTLAPGEQVSVDAATLHDKRPLDIAMAQGWTRGDLIFKNRRLDSLLQEMNRYATTPLRLADPALGAMTVSGVFHYDDQAALVAALERGWALRAERRHDREIVLHDTKQ